MNDSVIVIHQYRFIHNRKETGGISSGSSSWNSVTTSIIINEVIQSLKNSERNEVRDYFRSNWNDQQWNMSTGAKTKNLDERENNNDMEEEKDLAMKRIIIRTDKNDDKKDD